MNPIGRKFMGRARKSKMVKGVEHKECRKSGLGGCGKWLSVDSFAKNYTKCRRCSTKISNAYKKSKKPPPTDAPGTIRRTRIVDSVPCKQCRKTKSGGGCGEWLPAEDYDKGETACRECRVELRRQYYLDHPDRAAARRRKNNEQRKRRRRLQYLEEKKVNPDAKPPRDSATEGRNGVVPALTRHYPLYHEEVAAQAWRTYWKPNIRTFSRLIKQGVLTHEGVEKLKEQMNHAFLRGWWMSLGYD